jgi:hypothetical protein
VHTSESVCLRRPRRPEPSAARLLCRVASLAAGLAAVLTTACATLAPGMRAGGDTSPAWNGSTFRPESEYMTYMHMLAVAPPATQKSLYQQAARSYREHPTPHSKLRFALALGLLGAPYGDAAKARQLYKELLPAAQAAPAIESLLQIRLSEAQHRLALEERLALLQQRLEKAEAKIQALTTIEQTLEQPAPENRTRSAP